MQVNSEQDVKVKLKVLLADDHTMILDLISLLISSTPDIDIFTATDVQSALDMIVQMKGFDLVLLDVDMPGMHGVEGLQLVKDANPQGYIGLITGEPTHQIVMAAKRAGAAGVISKKNPMRSLANTIRFMAMGEQYFPMDLIQTDLAVKPAQAEILSDREYTVLKKLADGMSNKEIGESLRLAEPTIKMHIQSIYKKLMVNNRTQAVIRARDLKIV